MRRTLSAVVVVASMAAVHGTTARAYRGDENPLDGARRASSSVPFSGEVLVKWRDGSGLHEKTVKVWGRDGSFQAEGQRTVLGRGAERLVHDGGEGWRELWPSGIHADERKDLPPEYSVRPTDVDPADGRQDVRVVAGETAKRVDVLKGTMRERLDLDERTGFLLAREQYDGDGRTLEQSFEFTSIKLPDPDVPAPAVPAAAEDEGPDKAERPSAGAPRTLNGGYRLIAAYNPQDTTQLVYGDGYYDISLFKQRGRLQSDDLPAGRRTVSRGGHRYAEFSWPGGQGVIWAAGGAVYTLVGDAPSDELVDVAASVPVRRSTSIGHRFRQACRGLVKSFTGGS